MSNADGNRWTLERLWQRTDGAWCMVVMNPIGFRNGYVRLPDGHPWATVESYDDIPVAVHGGLTFGPSEYPADQLENGDGVPDGLWIGFDCGHWPDAPDPERYYNAVARHMPEDLRNSWPGKDGHVWTVDEVAAEVANLADQVMVANAVSQS